MLGIRSSELSMDVDIEHVKNPQPITGDEEIALSVLDNIVSHFRNNRDDLIGLDAYQRASLIQTKDKCTAKFEALRELIDSSPLINVVPNELNKQTDASGRAVFVIIKVITLGINQLTSAAILSEDAIARLRQLKRSEIKMLAVSEQASERIDNVIRKYRDEERAARERARLERQKREETQRLVVTHVTIPVYTPPYRPYNYPSYSRSCCDEFNGCFSACDLNHCLASACCIGVVVTVILGGLWFGGVFNQG